MSNATQFSFNPAAEGVEADTGYDVLPAGWYVAKITETEVKPTRSGDGTLLKAKLVIMYPEFAANRVVFTNFNLTNPVAEAVKIGKAQLTGMMQCIGVLAIQQTTGELHEKPMCVKLKVNKATDQYGESNEVQAYKRADESVSWAVKASVAPIAGAPPAGPPKVAPPPAAAAPPATAAAAPPATAAPVAAPPPPPAATTPPVAAAAPVAAAPAPPPAASEPAAGDDDVAPWLRKPA